MDVTSADMLDDPDATLNRAGIDLCGAGMKDPVKDKLKRFGLFARLVERRFFATLDEAVNRDLVQAARQADSGAAAMATVIRASVR